MSHCTFPVPFSLDIILTGTQYNRLQFTSLSDAVRKQMSPKPRFYTYSCPNRGWGRRESERANATWWRQSFRRLGSQCCSRLDVHKEIAIPCDFIQYIRVIRLCLCPALYSNYSGKTRASIWRCICAWMRRGLFSHWASWAQVIKLLKYIKQFQFNCFTIMVIYQKESYICVPKLPSLARYLCKW